MKLEFDWMRCLRLRRLNSEKEGCSHRVVGTSIIKSEREGDALGLRVEMEHPKKFV